MENLNKTQSNREKAIAWWNDLASARKTQICDTNTELVGSVRRWETLTGREVQELYEIENFDENRVFTLKEVKILMAWARDRGERHGEILYTDWEKRAFVKLNNYLYHTK